MLHKPSKRLVEVCPQCCQSVSSSDKRLVQDSCGHLKCRICLLTESSGCLLCAAKQPKQKVVEPESSQARKSVITSLAIQIAEQKEVRLSPTSPPIVDKETCQIFNQTLDKEILFPTEIVKRSTGNFYHLKRIFSERFFNEDKKRGETDLHRKVSEKEEEREAVVEVCVEERKDAAETKIGNLNIPGHIEVRYYCSVHKVSFKQKHNIIRHHLTCSTSQRNIDVNPDNTVTCKLCNKTYKSVGKLNRHIKAAHSSDTETTKYKCLECSKCYQDNRDLHRHLMTHTKQKPHVCDQCGKAFRGKHNYERHLNKHNGIFAFICNDCGFKFLTHGELKAHSVTHSKTNKFTCTVCEKEFSLKRTLKRHHRTHATEVEVLSCHHCESNFTRKDNLERHMKVHHQEPTSTS